MERPPSDPEARERILKASMIRKGLPYISSPPILRSSTSMHDGCKCYVRFIEDTHILFVLRLGSHNPTCPRYRASLDPVDRRADDGFRARVEIGAPNVH